MLRTLSPPHPHDAIDRARADRRRRGGHDLARLAEHADAWDRLVLGTPRYRPQARSPTSRRTSSTCADPASRWACVLATGARPARRRPAVPGRPGPRGRRRRRASSTPARSRPTWSCGRAARTRSCRPLDALPRASRRWVALRFGELQARLADGRSRAAQPRPPRDRRRRRVVAPRPARVPRRVPRRAVAPGARQPAPQHPQGARAARRRGSSSCPPTRATDDAPRRLHRGRGQRLEGAPRQRDLPAPRPHRVLPRGDPTPGRGRRPRVGAAPRPRPDDRRVPDGADGPQARPRQRSPTTRRWPRSRRATSSWARSSSARSRRATVDELDFLTDHAWNRRWHAEPGAVRRRRALPAVGAGAPALVPARRVPPPPRRLAPPPPAVRRGAGSDG